MPWMRTPFTVAEAIDPVDSRMISAASRAPDEHVLRQESAFSLIRS
jgi:hypothetical protein